MDNKSINFEDDLKQSQAIMRIIHDKLKNENWIDNENKESLCYRIAEIMTAAKSIYTNVMPEIMNAKPGQNMLELLSELRLHYLNLSDLICEFDDLFMSSIIQEEDAVMPDADSEHGDYEIDEDSINNN